MSKRFSISLSPDEHRRLRIMAASQSRTMNALVREMIDNAWRVEELTSMLTGKQLKEPPVPLVTRGNGRPNSDNTKESKKA